MQPNSSLLRFVWDGAGTWDMGTGTQANLTERSEQRELCVDYPFVPLRALVLLLLLLLLLSARVCPCVFTLSLPLLLLCFLDWGRDAADWILQSQTTLAGVEYALRCVMSPSLPRVGFKPMGPVGR
jgi:hypothetical protein